MENKHQQSIPAEALAAAQAKLGEVAAALAPYTLNLTPEQRRAMVKMGDKSLAFVSKAHELAGRNPALCPAYLDMAEFGTDIADATQLVALDNALRQLQEAVDDTAMAAGSEAYQAALAFYAAVRAAAERNVSGARAVYEELRVRFPHVRRRAE